MPDTRGACSARKTGWVMSQSAGCPAPLQVPQPMSLPLYTPKRQFWVSSHLLAAAPAV